MSTIVVRLLSKWPHCVWKEPIFGYQICSYALQDSMAKNLKRSCNGSDWSAASTSSEMLILEDTMNREGVGGVLEPWDWWYYSEKVRIEQYDFSEDEVRPYFAAEMFCLVRCMWLNSCLEYCLRKPYVPMPPRCSSLKCLALKNKR